MTPDCDACKLQTRRDGRPVAPAAYAVHRDYRSGPVEPTFRCAPCLIAGTLSAFMRDAEEGDHVCTELRIVVLTTGVTRVTV